jgi:iron complex outermembrane recepter protein
LAAYAQATLAMTDRLSLTAGVRHTRDEKEFANDQYLITGSVSPIIFGVPADTLIPLVPRNSDVKKTFANTSPRASVDYRFSNDLMVYTSYSQGFKSGGFNLRYVSPRPAILPFDPEKVHTTEAGLKSELFARRLRANVAAFSTNYDDVQLTVFENLGAPVTLNGGDAKIKGGELELTALPVENLELSLSGGYLDAYYTSVRQSPAIIVTPEQRITTSTKLQKTPKWAATLGFDYDVRVPARGKVRLHADWIYTADVYNDAQNSMFLFQPASKVGNAALEYVGASNRWSLRLFVDNVTDKRVIVSGDSNYGIGFHEAEFNRPREWGIAGRLNF